MRLYPHRPDGKNYQKKRNHRDGGDTDLEKNMLKDLIKKNRSYRRFYQDEQVSLETLKELIDLARNSASAANIQPLRYILINSEKENEKVFSTLSWAGYLTNWNGPEVGEKPAAYIIVLSEHSGKYVMCDAGIACQSILLGATEKGLGGCMFGSVQRDKLKELLDIPEKYEILLVIALGKPKEKVVLEDAEDGNIRYYRDEKQVHHVPKRKLEDVIINL